MQEKTELLRKNTKKVNVERKDMIKYITFTCLRLAIYLIIAIVVFQMGKSAYKFGYAVFAEKAMAEEPGEDVTVTIREGASAYKIGQLLERKGLTKDAKLFYVQELLSSYHKKIQPGSYVLNTSYDIDTILAIISGADLEETETE